MTHARPPRVADAVLRLMLAPHDRDAVSGDLLEEYRECIYPACGHLRANLWYVGQVGRFLRSDNQLWTALLGAAFVVRTVIDWLVPTADFHARSATSTILSVGILLCVGFSAAWRTHSAWTGAFAAVTAVVVGGMISIHGAMWLLLVYHDQHVLTAIQGSGGLAEIFMLPLFLIVPGACLGTARGRLRLRGQAVAQAECLVSRHRGPVNTEGAGGCRRARRARREEGAYREYVTDEQRRAPGCSAGRMSQDFGDVTLGSSTSHADGSSPTSSNRARRVSSNRARPVRNNPRAIPVGMDAVE